MIVARVFLLAEYVVNARNRLTIAGTYDSINVTRPQGIPPEAVINVPLRPSYIVAQLEARLSDGLEHTVSLRICNDDNQLIQDDSPPQRVVFPLNKHGRPMKFTVIFNVLGLTFPHPGDYYFSLLVDDSSVAELPMYVVDATPPE